MVDEYLKARKAGEKEYRARLEKGEYPYLPALDDILPGNESMSRKALGLMEIPVELIAGTKTQGRQNSFAYNFMPLLEPETEFASKWSNLYQAQMEEGFNSPIKVYEYLHKFYALEGNKRVSVSKFLSTPSILADVIRIIPKKEVLDQNPVYAEFLEFYKRVPIYDIVCTQPGSYEEIAELLGRPFAKDEPGQPDKWPDDLVKSLKSTYWRFSDTVHALQDIMPAMPLGDAFVIYLRIYVRDALSVQPGKELDKRLRRIRNELLTAYNSEKVSLVESSDDAVNAGGIITKTGGLITRPGSLIGKVIPQISYSEKHPLKAAFIYDWIPQDSDWVYNHDVGRRRVDESYGGLVRTKAFAGCSGQREHKYYTINVSGPDAAACEMCGSVEAAIDAAAEWGADVVFTTSPRHMNDALRAAIRYEHIHFLNCSVNLAHQAVRTYYAKLYEAKFLAGVLAGIYSAYDGTHRIGYRSDYPLYGTIAGINAFAIGAAMTDPQAKVYLEWSTRQDTDWWWAMQDRGIHVVSAIDSKHNIDGTNAYGLCYIDKVAEGEGTDLSKCYRIQNLAAPIWKWGKLYEIIIKTILEGNYNASRVDRKDQATNYWWGMISGAVDIEFSNSLPAGSRQMVEVLRESIISGTFNPFDGELRSQDGIVRRADEMPLSSMDVIRMDWLNENIIGEIPPADALNDEARQAVRFSGVKQ